jgi:uncharacterized protein YbjQ (UPF0145 family)
VPDIQDEIVRDLPAEAIERLREMQAGPGGRRALFTSDLSVNEFLLVDEAGFEPVGLVVGSSIYHVGIQVARWSKSQELSVLTQAMYHARELAMERMGAEASELGADGVVGVRLDIRFYEWGGHLGEFIAIGTAVKARKPDTWKTPNGGPFTSDLSGQDFWTLLHMGYRPVSLVLGNCVYHVAHRRMLQAIGTAGRNVELPNFTQALYTARELAMERMQEESRRDQADGVVGVRVEEKSHVWGHHAIEFLAIGTAVARMSQRPASAKPQLVLSLG